MRYRRWISLAVIVVAAAARASAETPISAMQFTDSIGMNTHFAYSLDPNSVWYNATTYENALLSLGVRHVRDSLIPAYAITPAYASRRA